MEYDLNALYFYKTLWSKYFIAFHQRSPLCNYFPLSPLNNLIAFIPEEKKNYTQDILIPPKFVYKKKLDIFQTKNLPKSDFSVVLGYITFT